MVPKFSRAGRSFKGVVQYLMHDTGHAVTAERVPWTHTINLANDHVPSAVDEMLWTFRNAALLKQEAGVRAGGRVVEKPVRHLSLNWHPSQRPSRQEMLEAAEALLRHLRWHEHQVIIIAHTDKEHRHVHLVVNAIHPVTGRKLDDGFEFRHAQKWALAWELQHGQVYCQERLKPVAERDPSAPRPVWQLLEQVRAAREHAEVLRDVGGPEAREARLLAERAEWQALRSLQKDDRLAFIEGGRAVYKSVRNDVYRTVRKEFAPDWRRYFQAQEAGAVSAELAAFKQDLVARQRETMAARCDLALKELRLERDAQYRELLDGQKEARAELLQYQGRNDPALGLLQFLAERPINPAPPTQPVGETSDRQRPFRRSAATDPPFRWSERGGMVAQQRSAQNYLDRVIERARKTSLPIRTNPPQVVRERLYGSKVAVGAGAREKTDDKGMDPGPD